MCRKDFDSSVGSVHQENERLSELPGRATDRCGVLPARSASRWVAVPVPDVAEIRMFKVRQCRGKGCLASTVVAAPGVSGGIRIGYFDGMPDDDAPIVPPTQQQPAGFQGAGSDSGALDLRSDLCGQFDL